MSRSSNPGAFRRPSGRYCDLWGRRALGREPCLSSCACSYAIHDTSDGMVRVKVTTPDPRVAATDADRVAEIVWTEYPEKFSGLEITVNRGFSVTMTPEELAERFGDRPTDLAVEEERDSVTVIVVTAVVALLLVGLMVLVWMRGRRRLPPTEPPAAQQAPHPYQERPHFHAGP